MEGAYPEKSGQDRSGSESYDIDHHTRTEPHDLCEDARNRLGLAGQATSTIIQQTTTPPFHRITYGPCFKDKPVQILAFMSFVSIFAPL